MLRTKQDSIPCPPAQNSCRHQFFHAGVDFINAIRLRKEEPLQNHFCSKKGNLRMVVILFYTQMKRLHKLANTCCRVVFSFSLIFLLTWFLKVNPVWIVWFVNLSWRIGSIAPYECKKNHTREKVVSNQFYKRWKD